MRFQIRKYNYERFRRLTRNEMKIKPKVSSKLNSQIKFNNKLNGLD